MAMHQLDLPLNNNENANLPSNYRARLIHLLSGDLDFHHKNSRYASHNFHAFPAKFPPQLPGVFIQALTAPGEAVLDPMMGSGTTILEAYLLGRRAVGFDIDPLARLITQVKVTPIDPEKVRAIGNNILTQAHYAVTQNCSELEEQLKHLWDSNTKKFVDYWFAPETQIELLALRNEIEKIEEPDIRAFFEVAFSAIIITKSGGVSLALDLAHTRPHRAKIIVTENNRGKITEVSSGKRFTTKILRSALEEFGKRYLQNLNGLVSSREGQIQPVLKYGNAQKLPLEAESIDLIVTSPPYASNAIDYMRAHKFSLVWLGHNIDELGKKRKQYVGGETTSDFTFEPLPPKTQAIVSNLSAVDSKKGQVLHRYYSEMTRVLREMYRVLKPGKASIVVVGSSIMRGIDTQTHQCLAEIGEAVGFEVPKIGIRNLDRNRRMMPAGTKINLDSQIQQRMHVEYVIGFYKPDHKISGDSK